MKTLMKVEIEPIYVKHIPEILEPNKVYISEEYGVSIHSCLCGCGNKVVLPFGTWTNSWQLEKHENGKISFTPSIGNYQLPCRSHYIITKNVANFC
jgi:hypothetical protein